MPTFQVIDGQYREIFTTIERARAEAKKCTESEGYSGCVTIYEVGEDGERKELEMLGDVNARR